MANTFLPAQGIKVGKSLCEKDLADTARSILAKAEAKGCAIILPVDAVVANEFEANAPSHAYGVDAIPADGMILDIGGQSIERVKGAIDDAPDAGLERPVRRLRDAAVRQGHRGGRQSMRPTPPRPASWSRSPAAATPSRRFNAAGVDRRFTYVSTAGGAFLEWLEGKPLPGVEVLRQK